MKMSLLLMVLVLSWNWRLVRMRRRRRKVMRRKVISFLEGGMVNEDFSY